ncbi:MAG: 4Fe-4S binding protein [Candidatus Lokiarchaeota archaeon]
MNNNDIDIYKKLRLHLDNQPIGYPETESGVEIRILKHLFTPEQAQIALTLGFYPEKIKKIHRKLKNYNSQELVDKLDEMYLKGLINRGVRHEKGEQVKYYALAPLAIGMYEYQLKKLTPEFFEDVEDYFDEAFIDEFNRTKIPQLRTIPIEQTVEHEQSIASYDDLRHVIETIGGPIAVAECICRIGKDLVGDPCKRTDLRESCFSFRSAAKLYIEKGLGREISKEEALRILGKAQDDGLVLQPSNSLRPMNICTCCGCCCGVLSHQKKLGQPAQFFASNYYAQVDVDECIGCGICEERCNMDAVHMEDAIAVVDLARCIGCGVCVPTCTSEAIKLVQKKESLVPPKSTVDTYLAIMDKKAELARTQKE